MNHREKNLLGLLRSFVSLAGVQQVCWRSEATYVGPRGTSMGRSMTELTYDANDPPTSLRLSDEGQCITVGARGQISADAPRELIQGYADAWRKSAPKIPMDLVIAEQPAGGETWELFVKYTLPDLRAGEPAK